MMRFSFIILLISLLPKLVAAQSLVNSANWGPDTWVGAGSAVATSLNEDAFLQNPAGMLRFEGGGSFGGYWLTGPFNLEKWAVGIIDGKKNVLGGLLFDWTEQGDIRRMGFHPGAAYRTPYGAFGMSLNIFQFDGLPDSTDDGWYFSQTLGVLAPVTHGLMIGASVAHVFDSQPDSILPPEVRLGISYRKEGTIQLSFQADRRFEISDQDWNYSVGTDLYFKQFFSIQGGYRWDQSNVKGDLWSVGAAMHAPKLDFVGFYTKRTDVSDDGFGFKLSFVF